MPRFLCLTCLNSMVCLFFKCHHCMLLEDLKNFLKCSCCHMIKMQFEFIPTSQII